MDLTTFRSENSNTVLWGEKLETIQLAADFGSSGSLFFQMKSILQEKKCLKKRKPTLIKSTSGQGLSSLNAVKSHVYHAGDA